MAFTAAKFGTIFNIAGLSSDYASFPAVTVAAWPGDAETAFIRLHNRSGVPIHIVAEGDTATSSPYTVANDERATVGELPFERDALPRIYFEGDGTSGSGVDVLYVGVFEEAGS